MAISVDWATKIITVPKADTSLVSVGPPEIRELDVDVFRLALKDLEDDIEGMPHLDTHQHNTIVTVGGVTLARVVEIINGYTVTFEDGSYAVNLTGANNNISDVTNLNTVSIRSANSAGLVQVVEPILTAADKDEIIDGVLDEPLSGHTTPGSFAQTMTDNSSLLLRALGLMQENFYMDQTAYDTHDGNSLLTSARLRLYDVAGSVGTDSDVIATYTVTATYSGGELQTYGAVKQ